MSKEGSPSPHEPFAFTDNERLFDRISHVRLLGLLANEQTVIHEVDLSTNSFGEFLFVTASHTENNAAQTTTFWGMGYHESREQWLTNTWSWFDSQRRFNGQPLSKEDALAQIETRRRNVLSWDTQSKPSQRAELFALLADLTDEDGALTEMEDLGNLFDLDE